MNVWEVLYQNEKMQKWKCKVLLLWSKDFHYFIILYLNQLWMASPWNIFAPKKSGTVRWLPIDISSSQKYQGPAKNKGVHCWSLLEKSGSWNYPGPGKNQGLHCWTLLEISRGYFFYFLIGDWLANLVWLLEEKSFWMGFCNKILENW